MSMKTSDDTIGDRARDLPACSAVPQPTSPPCVPPNIYQFYINLFQNISKMFRCTVDHLIIFRETKLQQWESLRALSFVTHIPKVGIEIKTLHQKVCSLELDCTKDKWHKEACLLQRSFENRKVAKYTCTSANLLIANTYVSFHTFQGRFIIVFSIQYDVTGPTHHSSFCCWQQYLPWTPCFSETKNRNAHTHIKN